MYIYIYVYIYIYTYIYGAGSLSFDFRTLEKIHCFGQGRIGPGPKRVEACRAESSKAKPAQTDQPWAKPSRAEPKPSRAEPIWGPSRVEPRAEPSQAEPSQAGRSRARPIQADLSRTRAELSRAGPGGAELSYLFLSVLYVIGELLVP